MITRSRRIAISAGLFCGGLILATILFLFWPTSEDNPVQSNEPAIISDEINQEAARKEGERIKALARRQATLERLAGESPSPPLKTTDEMPPREPSAKQTRRKRSKTLFFGENDTTHTIDGPPEERAPFYADYLPPPILTPYPTPPPIIRSERIQTSNPTIPQPRGILGALPEAPTGETPKPTIWNENPILTILPGIFITGYLVHDIHVQGGVTKSPSS